VTEIAMVLKKQPGQNHFSRQARLRTILERMAFNYEASAR